MNAIEVRGLCKSYGAFAAIDDISFDVPQGQVFAFLGPNGAGKTTTVEILEGYRQRDSGAVSVLGFDPGHDERDFRGRIGVVLQECGFPRYATVSELITLQAGYYPDSLAVGDVIELVGLQTKRTAIVRSLSGGQQRRLDLALALVGNPDLIFLDEPTTGFDPSARRDSWDTVANLRTLGKTVFLTTHYMDEAQFLADHVVVIAAGKIIAEGPPTSLGGRDVAETVIRFTLSGPFRDATVPDLGLDTTVTVTGDTVTVRSADPTRSLHDLTAWALARESELPYLEVTRPTLEDIYLKLTAEAMDNR